MMPQPAKCAKYGVAAIAACLPLVAYPQAYPAKPIRLVVTAAPGGGDDFQGRLLAHHLSEAFHQQAFVENRPGGGGIIGREYVARSTPDGYTLLLGSAAMATVPSLHPNARFNVLRDFTAISQMSNYPLVLLVHPTVPAHTVKELIALAKKQPGKLNFGSSGTGGNPHLAAELFKSMAHIDIVHIPYQGSAPAYVDLMSGRLDMCFGVAASALPQVRSGKVRALAVTGARRAAVLPDVPTMSEAALPGYELPSWMALFGPAAVTREIVNKLNAEVNRMVASAGNRERMMTVGVEPEAGTPEQLHEKLKTAVAKVSRIIHDAGIKPDDR